MGTKLGADNVGAEVVLASTTMPVQFPDYVSRMMRVAGERYNFLMKHPREKLTSPDHTPENLREYNTNSAHPRSQQYRKQSRDKRSETWMGQRLSSADVLDGIWQYVAPGGQ
eukprot:3626974-Lingulodinium_polyedra.AAC.1